MYHLEDDTCHVRRKFEKVPEVDQLLVGLVSRQDRLDR
jgi:hypothetical protein